ncbi:MAG: hypothetical protein WBS19_05820 [Candidatus Korobacteraceae bacterium]
MAVSGRFGTKNTDPGVVGHNDTFQGVSGTSGTDTGVFGSSTSAKGVHGNCDKGSGVFATSKSGQGVTTFSTDSIGIFAQGGFWAGVFKGAIVVGKGPAPSPGVAPNAVNGIVINDGGSLFLNGGGDVILGNADCAEDFALADMAQPEPGTVMVLDAGGEDKLSESSQPYDKCVVGVVSGAGSYKPGIVLDRRPDQEGRAPVALLGKVYCKVDAQYGEIHIGDLLSTSPTRGHAMKASDQQKAFGATLGKALRPLSAGCGLIPILVALQ